MLDFGRPIVLTDVYIPACSDLTSLSVDIWTQLEEVDGQRLAVAMDIESRDLVLNDLLPPPVCRYLKVRIFRRNGQLMNITSISFYYQQMYMLRLYVVQDAATIVC